MTQRSNGSGTGTDDHTRVPVIRVFSSSAAPVGGGCPAHRRIRADHSARASGTGSSTGNGPGKRPTLCDVPFGPLGVVLDLVEHGGWPVGDACGQLPAPGEPDRNVMGEPATPPHGGLLAWVRHAARAYLRALTEERELDGVHRSPVFDFWVRQYMPDSGTRHSRPYEMCAWGRRYTYLDGADRVRELRIPVMDGANARKRAEAEVAVAAYVLATGTPVDRDAYADRPWRYLGGAPYPMRGRRGGALAEQGPPDRVRVVQVSCLDSSTTVLYDGSAADAEESFAASGREGLRSALVGGARSPGGDCLSCGARAGCGRLPRAPGLLGVTDRPRPRRSWSVAVGRRFRDCPAQAHFHSLGLPARTPPEPGALRRDRAVRARLEELHTRLPRRPCIASDLPADPASWSAGGRKLRGGEARAGAAMLAAHVEVCPLHGLPSGSHVRVNRMLAADDTRADVLVLARADLLHHRGRSWIHRSVRTATGDPPPDSSQLLARDPELAVAVLFFASGVIPLEADSAVELEVLTPDGADVRSIDPGQDRARAEARRVVQELAEPWHRDLTHAPTPGTVCRSCPYRRWCPASPPDAEGM